ncbi:MAG: S8 family serine peptidase [Pseudomonadota bacterium]|nr:S8 family serine peptidase [Pseudomonadota bacterium]
MKGPTSLKFFVSATALSLTYGALSEAMTPAQFQQITQEAQRNVIVILRDQVPNLPPARRAMGGRAAALAASQSAVLSNLPIVGNRKVRSFSTINAFAATVSASEAAMLSAHPMVQAVVPDAVIRPPLRSKETGAAATLGASVATSADAAALCNTLEPEALQLTHTAFADPSIPQAHQVRDGHGELVTGKGVKVAYLADGLDPTIPGFIHTDGSPVFIDYQDFTGDPAGTFTGGGEAFGDASSIAAQDMPNGKPLTFDISKFVNAAHPLPSPCNIRIRGMAPGASLVGLKVFSQINPITTSTFVQAIEYAVIHDDVDVINESFGGNPFPDNANDPISLANNAAVRAGVTVVVSTGDAGTAGTLGSPATENSVIASGATTQFRVYAQTGDGVIPLTKSGGFIDNNISGFSSAGFSQKNARTVDAVAPGDLGWSLCSPNQNLFVECSTDAAGFGPSAIEVFGGTSESSPLTAGEAALVIQAYRSTHGGNDPTPATVKRIIMSTATDLGAPASEQGAGFINALAAVNAALSIDDENGDPKRHGGGVLIAPISANVTSEPNVKHNRSFTITNTGSTTQHLTPSLETLGAPFAGATVNLTLDPTVDPKFINVAGNTRVFTTHTFKVPANADHLDVAIAFQSPIASTNPPLVFLGLVDPSGRQAAVSNPQGLGSGYGHVDVVKPQAGTWTAIVYTRKTGVVGSYSGPVQFTWGAERYVSLGSVSPSHLVLAPGASETVTAEFSMPAEPGDSAAAIRFNHSPNAEAANFPEVPVTLRTLIPTGPTGGNFTGTLTGGNGRPGAGPTQTFAFDVPRGVQNMSLNLEISDNGYLLEGLLVDPNGMELSVLPNQDPINGSAQFALSLSHFNPQPGRWKFVLLQNFVSSGNQTSLPFAARIGFNTAQVTAPTLPNGASVLLSATGAPVSIPIHVTNTGTLTRQYFADARLNSLTVQQLPPQPCSKVTTLPGACGQFIVPTETSTAAFFAQSPAPITMDAVNSVGTGIGFTGTPDIFAKRIGTDTVAAFLSEPEVPYSTWFVNPSLIGPFGPAGVTPEPVTTSAFVLMQPFDSAVSADSGDAWADLTLNTSTFNPLVLAPGQSGTIKVTITPNASEVGKTVSGFIYIDTFDFNVFSGDETVRIPYSYTVAP